MFDPADWPHEDNPAKRAAEHVFAGYSGIRPSESATMGEVFGDRIGEVQDALRALFGLPIVLTTKTTFGEVYAPLYQLNY